MKNTTSNTDQCHILTNSIVLFVSTNHKVYKKREKTCEKSLKAGKFEKSLNETNFDENTFFVQPKGD